MVWKKKDFRRFWWKQHWHGLLISTEVCTSYVYIYVKYRFDNHLHGIVLLSVENDENMHKTAIYEKK